MSEHIWAEKHIADYATGEMTPEDAERFETHARDCAECAQAIDALQVGVGLEGLFTEIRPTPGLADRTALAFRSTPHTPHTARFSRSSHKVLAVIAAILVLGTYGAMATNGLFEMSPNQAFSFIGSSIGIDRDLAERETTIHSKEQVSAAEAQAPLAEPHAAQAPRTPNSRPTDDDKLLIDKLGQPNQAVTHTSEVTSNTFGTAQSRSTRDFGEAGGFGGRSGGGGMGGGGPRGAGGGGPNLNITPPSPPTGFSGAGAVPQTGTTINQTGITINPTTFLPGDFKPTLPTSEPKSNDLVQDSKEPTQKPKAPSTENPPKDPGPTISPEPVRRIIIRSGDIEFELDSFDAATATITKLVTEIKGAFISTVNSEKLPSGRVKGSITVRIPPEHLDSLVLDLRKELGKGGELKGIRITSQDVTKQYTDLESRLRGARTMEGRLIQIIKEGKGEIKQLLEAERELGVWRTKIEEFEGELRYYANLAALSTLTITLTEKEARAAAVLTESERVQAGVEVEDVDKAYQQLLVAVAEAKGRVIKSELKQYSAGQFNATLNFEVAPDAAGPLRDRLRQLGRMARLEIDRGQHTEGGTVALDTKPKRGDTVFLVQLYNLANIAARETVTLQVAAPDVSTAYRTLREAVAKATGRVVTAQLNEQDLQNVTAQIDFEIRRPDEATVQTALDKAGEVISRQATRAPESDNVTDTKVLHRVTILAAAHVKARETVTLRVASPVVSVAYRNLRDAVVKATGRVVTAQLNEQDQQNVTAQFDFEIRRTDDEAVRAALEAAGEVISRQASRAPESENASDAKILYLLAISATSQLKPRETTTLTIEVADVEAAEKAFTTQIEEMKGGRRLAAQSNRESSGKTTAKLSYEVPLAKAQNVVERFRTAGTVHVYQTKNDPQAPDGKFATARLDVTLTNSEGIVPADDGVLPQVRRGLSYSASALLKSVTWVIFGLCVVLPWAIVAFVGYRVIRWGVNSMSPSPPTTPTPSPAPPPTAA